ncbi:MAG: M15 family metallopeptidase, partial [Oscillospiraceae bacterium]
GVEAADRYSARPGYSEHQTGLTYDIGEKGKEDVWLTEAFGETPAGKWVAEHAHEYGFIMRYPKGKEEITGYMYESWHFRYVGVDIATEIYKRQGTLEEYLGISK